jgi:hypothetical protein
MCEVTDGGWLDEWTADMKARAMGKTTPELRKALHDLREGGYSGKSGYALEAVIVAELAARETKGGEPQ